MNVVSFGSKAETLESLELVVKKARVLPQIRLNASDWDFLELTRQIEQKGWKNKPLIVRSSANQEDAKGNSLAGRFASVMDVQSLDDLCEAVNHVISSYDPGKAQNQVFIQPMLQAICLSGVAFSCDPTTGAPYWVINYDDELRVSNSVTSGTTNSLKLYYAHRSKKGSFPQSICQVIEMLEELELYFGQEALDVEFAITEDGQLFLLQVRPLATSGKIMAVEEHSSLIENIESKIEELSKPHPCLLGTKSIFGVMPDWNPAEIIGTRPRPLALSLYKEVITDVIWAQQRSNYGYRNLRGFPLLVDFQGIPFINVRVSFNSFVPSDLDDQLASKLVDYYLIKLEKEPHFHDKVEFEIIHSCYTFDLSERLVKLKKEGFDQGDIDCLKASLKSLTNRVNGLCLQDLKKVDDLEGRIEKTENSSLDNASKIRWLLEDCKFYGTAPFAGIARSSFIAMQLLRSLVSIQIFSSEEMEALLSSLDTVCSQMQRDRFQLGKKEFLDRYGHLREGTYDILSPRYDEMPDDYFDWKTDSFPVRKLRNFLPTSEQLKQIDKVLHIHGLEYDSSSLLAFIKLAIKGREHAKFVFSKSISAILQLVKQIGKTFKFTVDECSYIDIHDIKRLYLSSPTVSIKPFLSEGISYRKKVHAHTKEVLLPSLITSPKDVWSFGFKQIAPNYITLKKAVGRVCVNSLLKEDISGKIIMIPSADPGYDWIFTHPIKGLITMYGGVNSHMAIRCIEMNIPAVIGSGEALYHRWSRAKILKIDCENKIVEIVQ